VSDVSSHAARAFVRCTGACTWAAAVLLGCASDDLALSYVRADERSVDLYAERPAAPTAPITNGEDALAIVLRDEALIRHLRRMDSSYSGRRREKLAWKGEADFQAEPPEDSDEPLDEERRALDAALREAVETEGGYWRVRVASDVRETSIFYVCELRVAPSGRPLGGFEPKRACGWRNP
jgi:hypothetical protein